MNATLKPTVIEKEIIPNLLFPTIPINKTKEEMKKLVLKLKRSMVLGNIDRTKMRIIFEDDEGTKEVRTTIWAVGDKNIVLKKGVTIPINRLVDVIL
ncbi:MAG: hypothetical protein ACJ0QO_02705 [Parvicellaceae bacterium]|tara:strand:- start:4047 stop:4337 length:291 start_codon:yes stop_codon:yes gene_type:complete